MATLRDALGRPIPDEGPLRVWLDDDLMLNREPAEDRKHVPIS
jgi:hypothetical protein